MPGCSAYYCSNSSDKGFRLVRFPAKDKIRNQWIVNCGRQNWQPGKDSRLCEVYI